MMEMFFLVLNKVECLETILETMLENQFGGATIWDCTGMIRELDGGDNIDLPILGLLRHFHDPERKKCKTMMAVIRVEDRQRLLDIINDATGGLDQPDTGIAFTVPISYTEGLAKKA